MKKAMSWMEGSHHPRVTVMMALLAVLLLLLASVLFASRPTVTTGEHGPDAVNHAMIADGSEGSSADQDPYIARHAEIVQRVGDGSIR
jgi:hypothetical protein